MSSTLLVAFALIVGVGAVWFLLFCLNNSVLHTPDGIATVAGTCGDTMEIGLQIENDRVCATHHWTNGCSYSKLCVEGAAALALDKSVDEIKKINMISIMERVGQLPEDHLHCAQLAETTLQKSLADYLARQHA